MSNSTIAVMLATRMAELGMTDTDAARELDVSQPTVTRWRTGRIVPSKAAVPRLASFLGIKRAKLTSLLDDTDSRRPAGARDGTFGQLLMALETERGLTATEAWRQFGIDKSRYYRLRGDVSAPRLVDLPALASRMGVSEQELVMAAYRTELYRCGAR